MPTGFRCGKDYDAHVHVIGKNTEKTGCWINPEMFSWKHPQDHFKLKLFISASGITELEESDQQYLHRLISLIDDFSSTGKFLLLRLDKCYTKEGEWDTDNTKIYVPMIMFMP